jgi:predicted RNA binding protein YcfA (HicA-like mRNA interferase family)
VRIPREISGEELIRHLGKLGYKSTRQTGSHVRLTRFSDKGEHHITVPRHKTLRIGTLNNILADVASHLEIEKDAVIRELFE